MSFSWWILLAAGIGIPAWLLLSRYLLRPILAWRLFIHQLAQGKPGGLPTVAAPPWARETTRALESIRDRMLEMERQISDESLNLQAILGSMVEGVLITDARQQIRMVNNGLMRLIRLEQSPKNRSVIQVFRNADLQQAIGQSLSEGTTLSREVSLDSLEVGRYVKKHFVVTSVPLDPSGHGKPIGALAVFHDITELKALEAVRREFVANVSHELRTPLSILNGYIETLLDGAIHDTENAERFLGIMLKHGQRLNLLIEDLLTLSRLESGQFELQLEPVDLRDCCHRVQEVLAVRLQGHSDVISLHFPEVFPPVMADANRIDQVFFNLLDNAIKYGTAADLRIRIEGEVHDEMVELRIRDNGPGIPTEDQPHLFERFYRVHKSRSRDAGGTGLGLSIVKHIAQVHGGSVSLESVPGRGSTFTLRLPVQGPKRPVPSL